ncbi:sec-independent translocase [Uniformispora flossi]|uniref:sec-independent translocase n=1 Tax=Uniformispora flossi TaxID=3390723 RepID=UPI003C2C8584
MFDVGPLEMVALVVLAVVIFGPDKLPKMVAEAARTIRKFREFSNSAREDLQKELGPEFQNIKFEDLNPKTFVRKNLMGDDDAFGLKELGQMGTDLSKDLRFDPNTDVGTGTAAKPSAISMEKNTARVQPGERPPFDLDAT